MVDVFSANEGAIGCANGSTNDGANSICLILSCIVDNDNFKFIHYTYMIIIF